MGSNRRTISNKQAKTKTEDKKKLTKHWDSNEPTPTPPSCEFIQFDKVGDLIVYSSSNIALSRSFVSSHRTTIKYSMFFLLLLLFGNYIWCLHEPAEAERTEYTIGSAQQLYNAFACTATLPMGEAIANNVKRRRKKKKQLARKKPLELHSNWDWRPKRLERAMRAIRTVRSIRTGLNAFTLNFK